MQGSYKFQVRSPVGSHLSKLVATPDVTINNECFHVLSNVTMSLIHYQG